MLGLGKGDRGGGTGKVCNPGIKDKGSCWGSHMVEQHSQKMATMMAEGH